MKEQMPQSEDIELITNAFLIFNGKTKKDQLTYQAFMMLWSGCEEHGLRPMDSFSMRCEVYYEPISPETIDLLEPIVNSPNFNKEAMMKISETAGRLCHFVVCRFNLAKVWKHDQTYGQDGGSALIERAAPDPQLEGGNH